MRAKKPNANEISKNVTQYIHIEGYGELVDKVNDNNPKKYINGNGTAYQFIHIEQQYSH